MAQASNTEITSDDKLWSLLAYLFTPIIPVVILLMEEKKNRPFIKAHNAQALAWGIILWVVTGVLSFIVVGACVGVAGIILNIVWGVQAYQGKYVNIPVLSDFVKKQGWA